MSRFAGSQSVVQVPPPAGSSSAGSEVCSICNVMLTDPVGAAPCTHIEIPSKRVASMQPIQKPRGLPHSEAFGLATLAA